MAPSIGRRVVVADDANYRVTLAPPTVIGVVPGASDVMIVGVGVNLLGSCGITAYVDEPSETNEVW
jgi:hypothetical protein